MLYLSPQDGRVLGKTQLKNVISTGRGENGDTARKTRVWLEGIFGRVAVDFERVFYIKYQQ